MKKLALALVCLFSIAFFASCTQEGQPTIQVYNHEGYVQDGATVNTGEQIDFGFVVASSPITNSKLVSLVVKIDDDEWANIDLTGETEYTYTDYVEYAPERDEILGTSVITAVVTDAAGQTATATITLTINQPDAPILAQTFSWYRRGNSIPSADEMANYGLKFGNNYKEVFATILPLNENVQLYLCDGADFATITTMSEKNAYFTSLAAEETGSKIESYRNVTCNNSADYNDMLAVVYGENLYLIHITRGEIETGSYGTQVTIKGELK
jgi:hypothetical protein